MWQTYRLSPHRLAAPIFLDPRLSTRLGTWAQELLQWTRALRKAPEPCWSTVALEWWLAPRAHLHHKGDTLQYAVGKHHFISLCLIIRLIVPLCAEQKFTQGKFELLYCSLSNKGENCRQLQKYSTWKAKIIQTLNVNVIFYHHKWLYCVHFEINTEKQTSWYHDELSGFGPNLIGGSTVVVAKVALRLWTDLGQIKWMH